MRDLPFNLLIGPIYNPGVLGAYRHHPRLRWFQSHDTGASDQAFSYDFPTTTFADILAKLPLPGNWQPDILVWWDLIYQAVPPGIEECPFPTAVIVGDWNIHFLPSRIYTGAFDYILGDRKLNQFLHQAGVSNCHYWPGFSFEPQKHRILPEVERIYDVTFVGNLNHRVQQERGAYLEQLARLADQYSVQIVGGVYGEAYTHLLNQSKMVFNFSIRGEMNMRAYEAPACGAMLLMEDSNLEVRDFLTDGVSCVLYNRDNLVDKIHHYLHHPEQLQKIAKAGHDAIQDHSYEKQFEDLFPLLKPAFERFAAGIPRPFKDLPQWQQQLTQIRQIYRANTAESTPIAMRMAQAIALTDPLPTQLNPGEAEILNQLGKFLLDPFYLHLNSQDDTLREQARYYLLHSTHVFQHLATCRPDNPIVWYNLGVTLMAQDENERALKAFNQVVTLLADGVPLDWWFDIVQPQGFHQRFMVEWERRLALDLLAQPANSAQTQALLLWQSYEHCGQMYQRQGLWREAHQAYSQALKAIDDFGETEYFLAQTCIQLGYTTEAINAFERAFDKQPFMIDAWMEYVRLLLVQLNFDKAVQFLQRQLQVLTVNPILKSDEDHLLRLYRQAQIGWAISLGHSTKPYLLARFNPEEFIQIQSWSQALAPSDKQANWETITCIWNPLWPEPRCLLAPSSGWTFVENGNLETPNTVCIGTAPGAPPYVYHRSYDRPTNLAEGIIGPDRMPLFFPVSPMLEPIELDEQRPFQILLLVNSWQNSELQNWLQSFDAGLGKNTDVACILWNPWQLPNQDEIEQLNHWIQPDSLATIVLLPEKLSTNQTYTILQQCQLIVGDINTDMAWLLGWAIYLGKPILVPHQPRIPLSGVSPPHWNRFVSPLDVSTFAELPIQLSDLQQHATITQQEMQHFYHNETQELMLNLLWELRLQRL